MVDERIVLWGESRFESPYVFSVFVALTEKGLPFEVRTMSLQAGEHRTGDYASRSVTGRVPALQHGELWLAESSAIDEYLEDAFPPPLHPRLYPEAIVPRARARAVQAWLRSDLLPIREERPTSSVFNHAGTQPLSDKGKAAAERLVAGCETLLPPGASALFGPFCIADADLALMLQRLLANGDPVPERLASYARAVWERPSVRAWLERVAKARNT